MVRIKKFLPLVLLFSHNLCPMFPGQTLHTLPSNVSPPSRPTFDEAVCSYKWGKVSTLLENHDPNHFVWRSHNSPLSYLLSRYDRERDVAIQDLIYKTVSVLLLDDRTDLPQDIHGVSPTLVEPINVTRDRRVAEKRNSLFRILKPLVRDNIEDNCPDDVIKVIVDFTQ